MIFGELFAFQKEDAGCIVIAGISHLLFFKSLLIAISPGWSAGALSKMHFGWVRNLPPSTDAAKKEACHIETSAIFALFWNLIRSYGPREVVDDFETFMEKSGIYRMDPGFCGSGPEGQYAVPISDTEVLFSHANLAPPQGVCAQNYSR